MPADTPLGITYPLFTDPMDPAPQIAEIATDTDTLVQQLDDRLAATAQRPTGRLEGITNQVLVPNAGVSPLLPVGAFSTPMEDPANNRLQLTEQGVYLLTASVFYTGNGNATPYGVFVSINSSGGFISSPVVQSLPASQSRGTYITLSAMHYVTGTVTDNITCIVRHNSAANVTITNRCLTACKTGNYLGGF
ncbi:hypothetical protein ABZ456_29020 [Streptomyces sp. NPDC005776]|uniref:hypothetical protein n=1 Tax=Streptomyces sp. NPDC005776 TaxID=3154676 RepID=UPI0034074538